MRRLMRENWPKDKNMIKEQKSKVRPEVKGQTREIYTIHRLT